MNISKTVSHEYEFHKYQIMATTYCLLWFENGTFIGPNVLQCSRNILNRCTKLNIIFKWEVKKIKIRITAFDQPVIVWLTCSYLRKMVTQTHFMYTDFKITSVSTFDDHKSCTLEKLTSEVLFSFALSFFVYWSEKGH